MSLESEVATNFGSNRNSPLGVAPRVGLQSRGITRQNHSGLTESQSVSSLDASSSSSFRGASWQNSSSSSDSQAMSISFPSGNMSPRYSEVEQAAGRHSEQGRVDSTPLVSVNKSLFLKNCSVADALK